MKYTTTKNKVPVPFNRIDLLKKWKKATSSALVEVCTHENIVPWDCGCSFGCGSCSLSYRCNDCECLLKDKTIPTAKLITT